MISIETDDRKVTTDIHNVQVEVKKNACITHVSVRRSDVVGLLKVKDK